MITINQGGNTPIILTFDADITAPKFEASLHHPSVDEIKHWSKDDIEVEGVVVQLPLTEEETLNFPSGHGFILSVKLLDEDGDVIFYDDEPVEISFRSDKTPMTEVE